MTGSARWLHDAAPVLGAAFVVGMVGCAAPAPADVPDAVTAAPRALETLQGRALGTTWTVRWVAPADPGAPGPEALRAAIEAELATVDRQMSTWRDDSDLQRVRRAEGAAPVPEGVARVVAEALDLAAASGGAFDPTVQPLMELWGFHGTPRATLPSDDEIAEARARVDYRRVRVGREDGAPWVDAGGTALDLSAIAKGFAVDEVSRALSEAGIASHLVEVGGELRVVGEHPTSGTWSAGVSVPSPDAAPDALALVVRLVNGAVATSGNYRNRVVIGGEALGHTMDPRLGRPVSNGVASATVIAPDCATADGLATALMVLPVDQGLALIDARSHVEAAWLVGEGPPFDLVLSRGLRLGEGAGLRVDVVHDGVRPPAPGR
jgi:thiamine biosynthesis lipoprotein